jgi:hypothetical protein
LVSAETSSGDNCKQDFLLHAPRPSSGISLLNEDVRYI